MKTSAAFWSSIAFALVAIAVVPNAIAETGYSHATVFTQNESPKATPAAVRTMKDVIIESIASCAKNNPSKDKAIFRACLRQNIVAFVKERAEKKVASNAKSTSISDTSNAGCHQQYAGNLTPSIAISFEFPCKWQIKTDATFYGKTAVTTARVSSPDGMVVFDVPAPDVGMPIDSVYSESSVLINGKNYTKGKYEDSDHVVESINLGTSIDEYGSPLGILFTYKNEADRDELYRMLDTFKF